MRSRRSWLPPGPVLGQLTLAGLVARRQGTAGHGGWGIEWALTITEKVF